MAFFDFHYAIWRGQTQIFFAIWRGQTQILIWSSLGGLTTFLKNGFLYVLEFTHWPSWLVSINCYILVMNMSELLGTVTVPLYKAP